MEWYEYLNHINIMINSDNYSLNKSINLLSGITAYFLFLFFMFDKIEWLQNVLMIMAFVFAMLTLICYIALFTKWAKKAAALFQTANRILNDKSSFGSTRSLAIQVGFYLAFFLLSLQKQVVIGAWLFGILFLVNCTLISSNLYLFNHIKNNS